MQKSVVQRYKFHCTKSIITLKRDVGCMSVSSVSQLWN